MTDRRLQFGIAIALLALIVGGGCSTNSEVPSDEAPTEQAPENVDADHLADNPCGDTDWDEPPPDVTSVDD